MIRLISFKEKIYDPDLGEGVSSTQVVAKYLNEPNPQDYFISFTKIDKVGINPQSKYNTPIGIYSYPIVEYFDKYAPSPKRKIGSVAPFAGEGPYVNILEVDRSEGRFIDDVGDEAYYSQSDLEEDINWIIENRSYDLAVILQHYLMDDMEKAGYDRGEIPAILKDERSRIKALREFAMGYIERWGDLARFNTVPFGRFWNITRLFTRYASEYKRRKLSVQWSKLFRDMGYIGFADRSGVGIIHPSEPFQAVFLARDYFELIERIENVGQSQQYSMEAYDSLSFVIERVLLQYYFNDDSRSMLRSKGEFAEFFDKYQLSDYQFGALLPQAYNYILKKSQSVRIEIKKEATDSEDVIEAEVFQQMTHDFIQLARKIKDWYGLSGDYEEGWNDTVEELIYFRNIWVPKGTRVKL